MLKLTVDECISQLQSFIRPELQLFNVIPILQRLTDLMQSSETRDSLKSDHWSVLTKLAESASQILSKTSHSDDEFELFTVFLRFLRNSCGGCFENQDNILKNESIFNFAAEALNCFLHKNTPKEKLILKIAIQLFGNILLCNANSKPIVWSLFFKDSKFRYLLAFEDGDIRDCTMMVLFHCLSEENCKYLFSTKEGHDILIYIADFYQSNLVQWCDSVMDFLLDQEVFLSCYLDLPTNTRSIFLQVIDAYLNCTDSNSKVLLGSVKNIMNLFVKNINKIETTESEPCEIMTMSFILCSASALEPYLPMLQGSRDLLQVCIESLKKVHILGKNNSADFSTSPDSNPYCGFKRNLVRLIGNLSYNCKENQDLVRNLDGIPLVLDCSRIDAQNPFIKEWCIVAIRNLLKNNPQNQAIVAGISAHGDVVESDFLNDMGLQVQKHDGKIRIRPAQCNS